MWAQVVLPAAIVIVLFAAAVASLWAILAPRRAVHTTAPYAVRSLPLATPRPVTPLPAPPQTAAMPATASFGPRQRRHTAVAGATGDGKTTTLNTLLVRDIGVGAQCIVCSTHFTDYHPEDQPIDLRPLRSHFEAYYTPNDILKAMTAACKIIDVRLELYRAGQDVGHDIALYFGEWDTAIQRTLGDKATERLLHILDEGRKTRVWVGFIEVHGAQVKRFGGDSALRAAFTTRLAGNIDATSWRALIGDDIPRQAVPLGTWMTPGGPIVICPPAYADIMQVVRSIAPGRFAPIVSNVLEEDGGVRVVGFEGRADRSRTGTDDLKHRFEGALAGTPYQYEGGTADTDAPEPGTDDFLIYELVRRGKSANQVHEIVGGTRAVVLDKVRKYKEMLDTTDVIV